MEPMQNKFKKPIPLKFMNINFDSQTQIKHLSKRLKCSQIKSIWKVIIYTEMPDNLNFKECHHLY